MSSRRWRSRAERIQELAGFRLNISYHPVPWLLTSAQAARRLGVSQRTVERYRRELRQSTGSPQDVDKS